MTVNITPVMVKYGAYVLFININRTDEK
jgi:hypothetical protein